MKKILLLCILSLGLSCSNADSDTQINEKNSSTTNNQAKGAHSIEDDIDQLFYNFVNSYEYLESKKLVLNFNNKFNVSISESDFTNAEEMISWIENNIDKTSFSSLNEAKLEWNSIVSLTEQKIVNHPQLFEFIKITDAKITKKYFEKWIVISPITFNDDCDRERKDCEGRVLSNYLTDCLQAGFYTGSARAMVMAYADLSFDRGMAACGSSYRSCMGL